MATKNNPGNYDCYENALPDEPMFILLARDRNAPSLVDAWAAARELAGEIPEKVAEARTCSASIMTCSATCPVVWKTGDEQPHSDLCKHLSSVLSARS